MTHRLARATLSPDRVRGRHEGAGGPGIGAILLAAGVSRRMGAANKLAIEIDHQPLLRRSARILLAADLAEIVVVLGHQPDIGRALLADLPLTLTLNPDFRGGRQTSVVAGLRALNPSCRAVMICLADQPLLDTSDIDALNHAYNHDCPRPIMVPYWGGTRGNPIIISADQRCALLGDGRGLTCRRLIDANPDLVWCYQADNDHFFIDLDTAEDHQRVMARLAETCAPET